MHHSLVRRHRALIVLFGALSVACAATDEEEATSGSAIVNGSLHSGNPEILRLGVPGPCRFSTNRRQSGSGRETRQRVCFRECTAQLLRPDVVLTTSACLNNWRPSLGRLQVRVDGEADPRPAAASPQEVRVHEWADLALVRLSSPVLEIEPIQVAAALPEAYLNQNVQIIGYGSGGTGSSFAKRSGTTQVSDWGSDPYSGEAILLEGWADGCFGDEGGPVFWNVEGRQLMIGVLSRPPTGNGCGEGTIAVRVASYLEWLRRSANELSELATGEVIALALHEDQTLGALHHWTSGGADGYRWIPWFNLTRRFEGPVTAIAEEPQHSLPHLRLSVVRGPNSFAAYHYNPVENTQEAWFSGASRIRGLASTCEGEEVAVGDFNLANEVLWVHPATGHWVTPLQVGSPQSPASPEDVAVGADGRVYVASRDSNSGYLSIHNATMANLATNPVPMFAGLAFDETDPTSRRLVAVNPGQPQLYLLDVMTGELESRFIGTTGLIDLAHRSGSCP